MFELRFAHDEGPSFLSIHSLDYAAKPLGGESRRSADAELWTDDHVDPVIATQIGVSGKGAGAAVDVNAIAAGNIASGRGC